MLAIYAIAAAPVVTIQPPTPSNNTYVKGAISINVSTDITSNVTFTLVRSDGTNATSRQLNDSTVHKFNITTSDFTDGSYNVTIRGFNASEGSSYLTVFNMTIDNTIPLVQSPLTPASSTNRSGNITVTANISDATSGIRSVVFSVVNSSGSLVSNLTPTADGNNWSLTLVTLNNATYPDGIYNISINATDGANNSNYSASTISGITIDNTAPVVRPLTPAQSSNITAGTNTINVTVTDATTAVVSVTFFIFNSSGNLTDTLTTTQSGTNYTASWNTSNTSKYVDGIYNVSVNASDTVNNINYNTSAIRVTVDNTAPVVRPLTPAQSSNITAGTNTINVTVTDATTAVVSVTFFIFNSSGNLTDTLTTTQSGTNYTASWNTSNTSKYVDGIYNVSVNASDTVNNINYNTSAIRVTVDSTAPTAPTPVSPANSANRSGTVNISITVTDATSGVATVQFGIVNSSGLTQSWLTASSAGSAWSALWGTTGFADGTYNISVNVTDSAGNLRSNTSLITGVVVDNTLPAITGQLATASTTARSLTITWNVSELVNGTLRYGTSASGFSNTSGVTAFRNNHTVTITSLEDATLYYYNITGCDNAGNCNTSGPYNASTNHVPERTSGSGETASGGGATTVTISTLNTVGATAARTFTAVNEKVTLANLPGTLGTHSVTYKSADESTKTVTVEVASTPKTLVIGLGESKKVDLNDDNTYDLLVSLTSFVSANNFQLKFEVLASTELVTPLTASTPTGTAETPASAEGVSESAPAPEDEKAETKPVDVTGTTTTQKGGLGKGTWAVILIIVLLAGWFGWKKLGIKK